MDKVVLDLETKKSFDEVGGQQNAHLLEVSVVGAYSYGLNKYRAFRQSEFSELEEWLKKASLIIGFNSKKFDFTVLQPYFRWKLDKLPHLDILEEVQFALGHRLKLDSIATVTLGEGKSGSGLDAIWYYKNQDWDKLIRYCLDDVRVTKELYDYGERHGRLWFENNGQRQPIPIRWGSKEKIIDSLQVAMKYGRQVKIEYLKFGNEMRALRDIDVKEVHQEKNQILAFCHQSKQDKHFDINRIFAVEVLGQAQSFQASLF
ncbi:MAG: hypothetical protein COX77_05060 [Candidatus Komeilibacteria bacterium CG_4_10_14_0_2_um_filter_37_10]|uniref:YprB ribonuclease H-like domain-containing protein n=1 Tax=Candidatus Komeilibacteria bacterium CG_4_10_14_0_2_um_filter_37_10 TaxID=1974470 RepID=A0A2M7VD36_9BACT|nr:MAG: hypothetical protein COX77_05060 [Candidatus Komeilibacteria bacterium CG_4_10_14_0_2_um_filter_37_10]